MRRTLCRLGVCVLLALATGCAEPTPEPDAPAAPTPSPGDPVGVTGLLIDTRCYALDQANVGNDHANRPEVRPPLPRAGCAAACARLGFPVAVQENADPDGTIWILSFPPQVFADYMGRTVRVEGEFRSAGILIPQRVEMQTADGWTVIM